MADNGTNNRVDITINAVGGSGGGGSVLYGAFASLPSSADAGTIYYFTDSPYSHAISDGTGWHYLYPKIGEIYVPSTSGLTWANQGSATLSNAQGPLCIMIPGSASDSVRALEMNYPATPFTVEALLQTHMRNADYVWGLSLAIRDAGTSTSAKILTFGVSYQTQLFYCATRWANQTSYNNSYPVGGSVNPALSRDLPVWHKLEDNGTNLIFSISYDNRTSWIQIVNEPRTAYLTTPTKLGIAGNSRNSYLFDALLLSWELS
jgi:hypothetical protein